MGEKKREQQSIQKLRQEIENKIESNSSAKGVIVYQKNVFVLCRAHQQSLIEDLDHNSQDTNYLNKQLSFWRTNQDNLNWLINNIEETIVELKRESSLFNSYNRSSLKESEELLKEVKSFVEEKSPEEVLQLLLNKAKTERDALGMELAETEDKLRQETQKLTNARQLISNLQKQLNKLSQPKRINKKTCLVGGWLATTWLANSFYNPGCSTANQLSILNNSTNNPLNYPVWENVPNNWMSIESKRFQELTNARQVIDQEWINKGLLDPAEVQLNYTNLEKERDQRPNITLTRYEELLEKEIELSNRPNFTQTEHEEIIREKNEWKTKYEKADLKPVNLPDDWETKLKEWKEFGQRPNLTTAEYNNLLNNQKPTDLPLNWKSELNRIPNLEKQIRDLETRPNITHEEFANYQSPEQVTEKERLAREQIENKYRGFINPADQKKIIELARQAGYQFTQNELDEAVQTNDQTWSEKGLIDPRNATDLTQSGLIKLVEAEQMLARQKAKYEGWINPQDPAALKQANLFTHQQLEEAAQKAKTELQTKLNQIQTELGQTQIDKGRLLQGTNSLYQEYQKKLNKINNLQNQIQQHEQRKTQQEKAIVDLTTQLNTARQANHQQQEKTANLEQQLNQSQEQVQQKKTTINQLNQEKNQQEKVITDLRTELDQTKQHETLLLQATERLYQEQQNNSNQFNNFGEVFICSGK
jgi:hypothetical protein